MEQNKIIINESFSDELDILDKLRKKEFESQEVLKLRVDAEEISKETGKIDFTSERLC